MPPVSAGACSRLDPIRLWRFRSRRREVSRYGFRKTTVAKIPGDGGMLPAKLYRDFASKEEIGRALCTQWMPD